MIGNGYRTKNLDAIEQKETIENDHNDLYDHEVLFGS